MFLTHFVVILLYFSFFAAFVVVVWYVVVFHCFIKSSFTCGRFVIDISTPYAYTVHHCMREYFQVKSMQEQWNSEGSKTFLRHEVKQKIAWTFSQLSSEWVWLCGFYSTARIYFLYRSQREKNDLTGTNDDLYCFC